VLHRSILVGLDALHAGECDLDIVRGLMRAEMTTEPLVHCDYAEIVDARTLRTSMLAARELRLLVAATVGTVRLIDNDGVSLEAFSEEQRLVTAGGVSGTGRER
jgi:pantoate--beta-alanine ligase